MKDISPFHLLVLFLSVSLPLILLSFGIYGSFLFTFSIPLFWQIGIKRQAFSSLGIKRKYLFHSVILGLASGIILGLSGIFILKILGMKEYPLTGEESILGFSVKGELGYYFLKSNKFLFLLYSIFSVGFGEELFWRGFIQQKLKIYFKEKISIIFTAILFTLVHFYFLSISSFLIAIFLLIFVFFLGIFWSYFFERYKNLFFPALSHGILAFLVWSYYLP